MFVGTLAAVSNREDWNFFLEMADPATNTAIDLTGASIDIAVRAQDNRNPALTGSLADGKITIVGAATNGTAEILFSETDMATLCAGQYDVGIRVTMATGRKFQLLTAMLPVVHGVVSA